VFVHLGMLLAKVGFGTLLGRFLLRNPRPLFGYIGPLVEMLGSLAMLARCLLAALSELALAGTETGSFAHPRQRDGEQDQYDNDDNDQNNETSGHQHLRWMRTRSACAAAPARFLRCATPIWTNS
jgi:hypothetical protein